jgi:hypothetical protein
VGKEIEQDFVMVGDILSAELQRPHCQFEQGSAPTRFRETCRPRDFDHPPRRVILASTSRASSTAPTRPSALSGAMAWSNTWRMRSGESY